MIYGDLVRLRAIERTDIERFRVWLNDPEVIEGLVIYTPLSLTDEEDWFDNIRKRPMDERPMTIEVQQDAEWIAVGNCSFFDIDWRCRAAKLGIFIGDKSFWNKGYGTKVMQLLLKHGFETLNLNRIALDVYENNPRAIRAYEKAGFRLEGKKRQAMYKAGRYMDVLIMSVLREEWREDRAGTA